MGSVNHISRIALIGAGPSAISIAKFLVSEKAFSEIIIFEQSSRLGGIWNYGPVTSRTSITIPQTNPHQPLEQPVWRPSDQDEPAGRRQEATFENALYETLETNIPHQLMQFSEKPFPVDSQLFPPFKAVLKYLEEYAEEVRHLIRFETQVVDVRLDDPSVSTWAVTTKDLRAGSTTTSVYDAVVVANGHYTVPHVPTVNGIEAWNEAYPGRIIHSKHYRDASRYKNRKVIVVGNSASGVDIGMQIGQVASKLINACRSVNPLVSGPTGWKEDRPAIEEFLSPKTHQRAVRFADGSVEEGIDDVIFATGFFYNYPFLTSLDPPVNGNGNRVLNVYKHLFYIEHPTLVLPALNLRIIPFPLVENQAAVIARVWSGRLAMPSIDEMQDWEARQVEEKGNGKQYHLLKFPTDVNYINELFAWAEMAEQKTGLSNEGMGRIGASFDEKKRWWRERSPSMKKAFGALGEGRHAVKTIEELGFDYEVWKEEQRLSDKGSL